MSCPRQEWTPEELERRAKLLEQFQHDDPYLMVSLGEQEKEAPWWQRRPVDPGAESRVTRTERNGNASPGGWRIAWWRRPRVLFAAWMRRWLA